MHMYILNVWDSKKYHIGKWMLGALSFVRIKFFADDVQHGWEIPRCSLLIHTVISFTTRNRIFAMMLPHIGRIRTTIMYSLLTSQLLCTNLRIQYLWKCITQWVHKFKIFNLQTTLVSMKIIIFSTVCQCFGRTYCLHIQGSKRSGSWRTHHSSQLGRLITRHSNFTIDPTQDAPAC